MTVSNRWMYRGVLFALGIAFTIVLIGPFLVAYFEHEADVRLAVGDSDGASRYESLRDQFRSAFFWNEMAKPIPIILWSASFVALLALIIFESYRIVAQWKANRVLVILDSASSIGSPASID